MTSRDATLRSKETIDRLYKEGLTYHGTYVVGFVRRVAGGRRQVLYVASRRVGNAVRRNRAKRLMRAAHRTIADNLSVESLHIAWVARRACAGVEMNAVREDMLQIIERAELCMPPRAGRGSQGSDSQ